MTDEFYVMLPSSPYPQYFVRSNEEGLTLLANLKTEDPGRWNEASLVSYARWLEAHQASYLAEPAREIDGATFEEALNILPPLDCSGVG